MNSSGILSLKRFSAHNLSQLTSCRGPGIPTTLERICSRAWACDKFRGPTPLSLHQLNQNGRTETAMLSLQNHLLRTFAKLGILSQREKTPSWPTAVLTNYCPGSSEDLPRNRPWLMRQTLKWEQSSWKTFCQSSNRKSKLTRKYSKPRRMKSSIFKIKLLAWWEMTTKNSLRLTTKGRRETTRRDSNLKNSLTHSVNRSWWLRIGLKSTSLSNCCIALSKKSRMPTMRWSRRFIVLRRGIGPRIPQRKIHHQGRPKPRIRSSLAESLGATEANSN